MNKYDYYIIDKLVQSPDLKELCKLIDDEIEKKTNRLNSGQVQEHEQNRLLAEISALFSVKDLPLKKQNELERDTRFK